MKALKDLNTCLKTVASKCQNIVPLYVRDDSEAQTMELRLFRAQT